MFLNKKKSIFENKTLKIISNNNEQQYSRVLIMIPKKKQKKAVTRNLIKRRIKSIICSFNILKTKHKDFIIIYKSETVQEYKILKSMLKNWILHEGIK